YLPVSFHVFLYDADPHRELRSFPTRRSSDLEGREEYLAKRRRVLVSTAHLIEIDLLRAGLRVPMRQPLPSLPYFAFVGRFEQRRSEEHTSELQSRGHLVCRLLLEKKKQMITQ